MTDRSSMALAIPLDRDWVAGLRVANLLVRQGRRVLVATGAPIAGSGVAPGTVVVPLSPRADPELTGEVDSEAVRAVARDAGVEVVPLLAGDRVVAAPMAAIRVGLYGGGGAPFNQASILGACGFDQRFVSDAEIRAGALDDLDVLIVPGGGTRAMHGQLEPLGEAGCRAIAEFVRRGGMYIGSCAGSYDCAVTPADFVQSCPMQRHLQLINARVWNDTSVQFGGLQSPGIGVVQVRTEQPDHPVMYGMPSSFAIAHYNGPIFEPLTEWAVEGASDAVGLAAFAGWTEDFTPAEDFAGASGNGDTLLRRAIAAGRYAAVAGYLGTGRVVAFGSHPEFGFDLPMVQWSQPARMLANAVIWQATSSHAARPASRFAVQAASPIGLPVGSALTQVPVAAAEVREAARQVAVRPIEPRPQWLTPAYALAFYGLAPDEIWRRSLADIQAMAGEIAALAERLHATVEALVATGTEEGLPGPLRAALGQVDRWLRDERPAEWHQDGGYQGVLALLRTAAQMCRMALDNWDVELPPPAGPYGYLDRSPYHLVAGSYLAGVGCVAGALHLLRALQGELDMAERLAAGERPAILQGGKRA
jgi:hypothetical protein